MKFCNILCMYRSFSNGDDVLEEHKMIKSVLFVQQGV